MGDDPTGAAQAGDSLVHHGHHPGRAVVQVDGDGVDERRRDVDLDTGTEQVDWLRAEVGQHDWDADARREGAERSCTEVFHGDVVEVELHPQVGGGEADSGELVDQIHLRLGLPHEEKEAAAAAVAAAPRRAVHDPC